VSYSEQPDEVGPHLSRKLLQGDCSVCLTGSLLTELYSTHSDAHNYCEQFFDSNTVSNVNLRAVSDGDFTYVRLYRNDMH
jgi:hypothetical protein